MIDQITERLKERGGLSSQTVFTSAPNRPQNGTGARPDKFERKGKVLNVVMDENHPPGRRSRVAVRYFRDHD
jgi:hypothetical protein